MLRRLISNSLIFLMIISILFPLISQFKSKKITKAGDYLQFAPVATASSIILICDLKGSFPLSLGLLTNLAITYTLKYSVSKERPNKHNTQSFPSGHTAFAFQAAAFIHIRYGWVYAFPMYIISSFVGYSRVQGNNHYWEDVIAGAIIGILSSLFYLKLIDNFK